MLNSIIALIATVAISGCLETKSTSKVFGGSNARSDEFPSVVGLSNGGEDIHCTGTFIRHDLLITAAHCIKDARRNGQCGYSLAATVNGKRIQALGILMHPKFILHEKGADNLNDLAFLFFPPNTSDATSPMSFEPLNINDSITLIGFGHNSLTFQGQLSGVGKKRYGVVNYAGEAQAWAPDTSPIAANEVYSFDSGPKKDAGILPGDSGGPMLKQSTHIVAVNWAGAYYGGNNNRVEAVGMGTRLDQKRSFIDPILKLKPVTAANTCVNNDYWLGDHNHDGIEEFRFLPPPPPQQQQDSPPQNEPTPEPPRPAIAFTWDNIPNYHYSFDIELRDGEIIAPCIGADVIGTATSGPFNGTCITQNNRLIDLNNVKRVTMVAALNGDYQAGPTQHGSLEMPVPLNLDATLHITIGDNQPTPDDGSTPTEGPKTLPRELDFTWDRHQNHQYSLDLELKNGEIIGPCVGANIVGNLTAYKFNGNCTTAGNRQVTYDQIKSVTIFAALNGDWQQGERLRGTLDLTGVDLRTTLHISIPKNSPPTAVETNTEPVPAQNQTDVVAEPFMINVTSDMDTTKLSAIYDATGNLLTPARTRMNIASEMTLRINRIDREGASVCFPNSTVGLDACNDAANWTVLTDAGDGWAYVKGTWTTIFAPNSLDAIDYEIHVKDSQGRSNSERRIYEIR